MSEKQLSFDFDVFNKNKIEMSTVHNQFILDIKNKAEELHTLFTCFNAGREMSLAKTKLEESVMWAVKGIANWCKQYPGGINMDLTSVATEVK